MDDPMDFTSQWAILPAKVRYDAQLPPNAKLLFAEIAAKTNTLGYCWAYNQYFAEKLGISADRVSDLIKRLERSGYIVIDYGRDRANTEKRKIYLTPAAFCLAVGGIGENTDTPSRRKHRDGIGENAETPLYNENNKEKSGQERPKYMPLDIFKAIAAWCGEDGDLMLAWMQYADMRQRTRKPIGTVATVERACSRIDKLSKGDRAYKIGLLHKATDSSWRGFYPLKEGDEGYSAVAGTDRPAQGEANERRPERWN